MGITPCAARDEVSKHIMICDLCEGRSHRIIRVSSWQVCQRCISEQALERALVAKSTLAGLGHAFARSKPRAELTIAVRAAHAPAA